MVPHRRPDAVGADQRRRQLLLSRIAAALDHGQPFGVRGHVLELAAEPEIDVRMVVDLCLQGALQAEVNDHPDIDLRLGCQFEDVTSHAKGLTVVQRGGNARQQELAAALVGADGIWSAVRNHLFPEVQPQFSGLIAWRGTLDATTLPREYTA